MIKNTLPTVFDNFTNESLQADSIDWDAPISNEASITTTTTHNDYEATKDHEEEEEPSPPPNKAIYPLTTQPGWKVTVTPYNPQWPFQFQTIKQQLHNLLSSASPQVTYTSIEHIGSTSIPGLCAKPNIDILITFQSDTDLTNALEAFAWETPSSPPYIKYTRVPDGGGIRGRESLKLYVPEWSPYYASTPERSVYLVNDDVKTTTTTITTTTTVSPSVTAAAAAGRINIRGYRDVKKTLCNPHNTDLLREYAEVKFALARQVFKDSITYSRLKDGIIRKILLRAGWTDDEVDVKEALSDRHWEEDEPPY